MHISKKASKTLQIRYNKDINLTDRNHRRGVKNVEKSDSTIAK